jgi:hypothetical protein
MAIVHRFEVFCENCLTCELFFDFGNKICPECGCNRLVAFGKLTPVQRKLAQEKIEDCFKKTWGNKG